MLLALHHITKRYGSRLILKDISCTISKGETVLLSGANGAGKSTLLRIMAGLSQPTEGHLETELLPENIGYLGHDTFLYPALSALDNLVFWAKLYHKPHTEAALRPLLARVELERSLHERAGVFSRGMMQRLNLARLLLLEPSLLLLDEPFTGLDSHSSSLLRAEITTAVQQGAGIVWISHDITNDCSMADRLLTLERHRLVFDGSAKAATLPPPIASHPLGSLPS